MPEHVSITDPDLHEPKGAASAAVNTVYVSDGAGSGSWGTLPDASIGGKIVVTSARMPDISTASNSVYVLAPVSGTVTAMYTVIRGPIATADATITTYIGATPITNGVITVLFSGSAAGDVDTAIPTAANTVSAGDVVEFRTDGASTNVVRTDCYLVIERT